MKARSPIEQMVNAVVRCTRCGKPPGCACWPALDLVTIRCPCCGRAGRTDRVPDDPPAPAVVDVTCPECSDKEEREQGRAALREFIKDAPRRPMTKEERAFFAEHKRKREAGEIRTVTREERDRMRTTSARTGDSDGA